MNAPWLVAEANWLAQGMLLAGVALAVAILMRRLYGRGRQGVAPRSREIVGLERAPRPDKKQTQPLIDAPPEIVRWQVEMHETARELRSELDNKLGVLQLLIGQLRREADRLEALLEKLPPSATLEEVRAALDEARRGDDS